MAGGAGLRDPGWPAILWLEMNAWVWLNESKVFPVLFTWSVPWQSEQVGRPFSSAWGWVGAKLLLGEIAEQATIKPRPRATVRSASFLNIYFSPLPAVPNRYSSRRSPMVCLP